MMVMLCSQILGIFYISHIYRLSKEGVLEPDTGARSFCGSIAYLAPEMLKK